LGIDANGDGRLDDRMANDYLNLNGKLANSAG
jgi:hypothetical protein